MTHVRWCYERGEEVGKNEKETAVGEAKTAADENAVHRWIGRFGRTRRRKQREDNK